MMKTFLFLLTFCAITTALGKDSLIDNALILYHFENGPAKYILCANFQTPEKGKISHIVMGDSFDVKYTGYDAFVVMTNAWMLNTRYGQSLTNNLDQSAAHFEVYRNFFSGDAKLIFNGSVYKLSKVNRNDLR